MSYKKRMPAVNDDDWYRELIDIKIDRLSLICIVGMLELALRHPGVKSHAREDTRSQGKQFVLRLIEEGMIVPYHVMESWSKTFKIALPY